MPTEQRLLASTSFRLTAGYAGLLIAAFTASAFAAWLFTKSAAEREVRQRVQLEMSALQYEIRNEGRIGAASAIRARAEEPGAVEYRFTDASGNLIVGDLEVENAPVGWSQVSLHDTRGGENRTEDFLLLTEIAPDGSHLTIADDLDRAEGIRSAVLVALLWVAVPTLLVVLGAGIFMAAGAARRMRVLSRVMVDAGHGDLNARAPETGGDDIARIGRGVNEMLARIDSLVVHMRRVSTDIAHDLRTPLAHVRQDLETAALSADPTTRDGIRAAQAKIDEILRVFQAILRLAEIDAGGARARFTPLDLAATVERVADAYRPDIEAAGRTLLVENLAPTTVSGDQDLVTLALANLIENAMRHTPAKSAIRIRLAHDAGAASLFVEDQGPGIPEADRARVLEPFVRLDSSRTTPGAGLGLSIVSAIARLHGARLSLEDVGPGLRVVIAWPAD